LFFLAVVLWFVPVLSVRFSSEQWSALAFLAGLSLLPLQPGEADPGVLGTVGAGVMFGLAFDFRFQLALALVPIVAWMALRGTRRLRDVTRVTLGVAVAVGLGMLVDHWFYGVSVLTPWRYLQINVLQGKAAEFGVMPWW